MLLIEYSLLSAYSLSIIIVLATTAITLTLAMLMPPQMWARVTLHLALKLADSRPRNLLQSSVSRVSVECQPRVSRGSVASMSRVSATIGEEEAHAQHKTMKEAHGWCTVE